MIDYCTAGGGVLLRAWSAAGAVEISWPHCIEGSSVCRHSRLWKLVVAVWYVNRNPLYCSVRPACVTAAGGGALLCAWSACCAQLATLHWRSRVCRQRRLWHQGVAAAKQARTAFVCVSHAVALVLHLLVLSPLVSSTLALPAPVHLPLYYEIEQLGPDVISRARTQQVYRSCTPCSL